MQSEPTRQPTDRNLLETGNRQRFSSPRMSKLDAVPENHSYEAVIEQQQQDAFDDGSPRRMPHPVPVRGASFSAKPIRRQLSIDSQMSASVRKMTPAELPTSRWDSFSSKHLGLH